jgi:hypothetical protein
MIQVLLDTDGIPDDTSIISLMVLNTLHMIEPKNVTDADCKKKD